ncbi:MAG: transcriptional repressor DicA [bacterium ADurb.Bin157]|nr:MAG: transcriptional repressor DicA [bacterium ADurb.Bin157]
MNIKELRKKQGLTQIELAKRVGVSMMTIQLWERASTKPNEENLKKLMEVLNVLPFAEE